MDHADTAVAGRGGRGGAEAELVNGFDVELKLECGDRAGDECFDEDFGAKKMSMGPGAEDCFAGAE